MHRTFIIQKTVKNTFIYQNPELILYVPHGSDHSGSTPLTFSSIFPDPVEQTTDFPCSILPDFSHFIFLCVYIFLLLCFLHKEGGWSKSENCSTSIHCGLEYLQMPIASCWSPVFVYQWLSLHLWFIWHLFWLNFEKLNIKNLNTSKMAFYLIALKHY